MDTSLDYDTLLIEVVKDYDRWITELAGLQAQLKEFLKLGGVARLDEFLKREQVEPDFDWCSLIACRSDQERLDWSLRRLQKMIQLEKSIQRARFN